MDFYKKVIAKVRAIYKYDLTYAELLKNHPEIKFFENKNGELELNSICFSDGYNHFIVTNKEIIFDPYYGEHKTLTKYSNLEELLKM